MNEHENCGHSEVHHLIMEYSEQISMAAMATIMPAVIAGEIRKANAGLITARMIFACALETGLRAALMDKIGAEQILAHLDETADTRGRDLEDANDVIIEDARHLLEAMARVSAGS